MFYKFTILCWATFIAILRHVQPLGLWLDTPFREYYLCCFIAEETEASNFPY